MRCNSFSSLPQYNLFSQREDYKQVGLTPLPVLVRYEHGCAWTAGPTKIPQPGNRDGLDSHAPDEKAVVYPEESLSAFHAVEGGTSSELTPRKDWGKSFCIRSRFRAAEWPNPADCIEEKPLEEISF